MTASVAPSQILGIRQNASDPLQRIERLLSLQVRLLAITSGLERDGETLAHTKQELAAVCRGNFDEVPPRNGTEPLDLADDVLGNFVADRIPDPAVHHRGDFHSQTPRVARALTRYVAGALLASLRQLQRRAWVRRAAATRPSGTNGATA